MPLCFPGAPRRAAISGAVALLLLALCGAVQADAMTQEGASAALAAQGAVTVSSTGRALRQIDTIQSDCSDCSCARVECAAYCESASNIRDFTCDEAGWFTNGKWLCECRAVSGSQTTSTPSSAASARPLGRLAFAVTAIACIISFTVL